MPRCQVCIYNATNLHCLVIMHLDKKESKINKGLLSTYCGQAPREMLGAEQSMTRTPRTVLPAWRRANKLTRGAPGRAWQHGAPGRKWGEETPPTAPPPPLPQTAVVSGTLRTRKGKGGEKSICSR